MYTQEQIDILNAHKQGRDEVLEAVKKLLDHIEYLSVRAIQKEVARIYEQYKI